MTPSAKRDAILVCIKAGTQSAKAIAKHCKLNLASVRCFLSELHEAGLIRIERHGNTAKYLPVQFLLQELMR